MPLNGPLAGPLPLEGLHVLVVDDDDDVRRLLALVLRENGATVCAVPSATEALDVLDGTQPHALVSDINMPGHDGYVFLQRLRARPAERGGQVPAIALTGEATPEGRERAFASGFQMFLGKPIELDKLVAGVAVVVGRLNPAALGEL